MKRRQIASIDRPMPPSIESFARGVRILDSSCSPEAKVYFLDREGGYYVKTAPRGTLAREATMTEYFHKKGLGAQVLEYVSADGDWLLTRAIRGEDCTHPCYLAEPERLCDLLAHQLRALHEIEASDCPVQDRMTEYLALADENFAAGRGDLSLFERGASGFSFRSADEAYAVLREGRDALRKDVLLHGDYCLPNIMLDEWKLSGFVDVGNGGVGDRHVDLFWGTWTLAYNLKTDRYRNRFLDAYGRDRIDEALLRVIAAAEVFG